jgi:hypothetical protein
MRNIVRHYRKDGGPLVPAKVLQVDFARSAPSAQSNLKKADKCTAVQKCFNCSPVRCILPTRSFFHQLALASHLQDQPQSILTTPLPENASPNSAGRSRIAQTLTVPNLPDSPLRAQR